MTKRNLVLIVALCALCIVALGAFLLYGSRYLLWRADTDPTQWPEEDVVTSSKVHRFFNATDTDDCQQARQALSKAARHERLDGWGRDMAVNCTPEGWEIRSAGRDGLFYTDDDMSMDTKEKYRPVE